MDSRTLARLSALESLAHDSPALGADSDREWALSIIELATDGSPAQSTDRAIGRLEGVVARDSTNARAMNDLAVAYLVRAADRSDATSLFLALDAIEQASRMDAASLTIGFNRALILERAHLYEEATRAWRAFMARSEGGWRQEASEHLSALDRERTRPTFATQVRGSVAESTDWRLITADDPQGAREYVLDSLVPAWARAVRGHDDDGADQTIRMMAAIANAIAAQNGDSSAAHVARRHERWRSDSPGTRRTLVDGASGFGAGAAAFSRGSFDTARPLLEAASAQLRLAGAHALDDWAELLLGAIDIYRADYRVAGARYAHIERDARARSERALEARALWGRALSSARQGRVARAADSYAAAATLFERISEHRNYGAMQSQLADMLMLLGRDDAALTARERALAELAAHRAPAARHGPLLSLGQHLSESGLPNAGVALLHEALDESSATAVPKDRPEALIRLASAEAAAASYDSARVHVSTARPGLAAVRDTSMRDRLGMDLNAAEARIVSVADPAMAISRWTAVDDYYRRHGMISSRAATLVRRARLLLRQTDTAAAQGDLAHAVTLIESEGANGAGRRVVRDLASARRDVYRELVAISISRNDTAAALAFAERGRGSRVDQWSPVDTSRAVIAYSVLENETLAWVITSRVRRMVRIHHTAGNLRRQSQRLEMLIRQGVDSAAFMSEAAALYDLLIEPLEPMLAHLRTLTIVTDGSLGRLPFAVLRDRSGRYAVEKWAISYALSVAAGFAVPAAPPHVAPRVLVVGDPAFDRGAFPDLAPLRAAPREAIDVAALYRHSLVMEGAGATKRAVLRALRGATLLHFAGHARRVDRAPELSHLVLARGTGGLADNVLSAEEIARLDLRRLRLVVLSSCGTTQPRSRSTDDQDGLAEAFLAAGAGGVISSVWEADDAGSAALMTALHRYLSRGMPSAAALRAAQVERLHEGGWQSVRSWGAFRNTES